MSYFPDDANEGGHQSFDREPRDAIEFLKDVIFFGAIGSIIAVAFFAWLAFGVCR